MAVSTNSLANSSTFSKHTNTYETEWERMLKTNSFVDMKKGGSSLALAHFERLKKSMGKKDLQLLQETNSLEEEYKREVKDTLDNDK